MTELETLKAEVENLRGAVGRHQRETQEVAEAKGFAWWIENGVILMGPKVDRDKFGPHSYPNKGIGKCSHGCGCRMSASSSSGTVDPFGACPNNPRQQELS